MFEVITRYSKSISHNESTTHYINRIEMIKAYKMYLSNNMLDCFIVDTGHKNGLEIHCINEHGLIYIYNLLSEKLITILNPRPRQLKRYYMQLKLTTPQEIRDVIKLSHKRNTDHQLNER